MNPVTDTAPPNSPSVRRLSDLKAQLHSVGLLTPGIRHYRQTLGLILLVTIALACVATFLSSPVVLIALPALLTVAYCQLAFVAHDASHGQVIASKHGNRKILYACALLLGI